MFPRVKLPTGLAVVGVALTMTAGAQAQLASKSPFVPPQAAAAGPTAGAPLEFRAYMSTSEGTLYRIYDPAKKAGAWVKLNERNPDFDVTIKQHDSEGGTITVDHQGKTLTLAARESKVVSSGNAAHAMPPPMAVPMPQPVAPSNVPPAVTQAVVLNPTPADEAKRLEAVAAEVARRRALREQAAQQVAPATPPQIAVPQVAPGMQRVNPPNYPQVAPQQNIRQAR